MGYFQSITLRKLTKIYIENQHTKGEKVMKHWKQPEMKELDIMNTNHRGGFPHNGQCFPDFSGPQRAKPGKGPGPGHGPAPGKGPVRGKNKFHWF